MKRETLGEICDRTGGAIQTGPFGAQLHQSDYREEGIAVVMPQDIIDNRISDTRIARIEESLAAQLRRHILENGDIVYPRRGDINKRAIVEDSLTQYLCGTGCLKISVPSMALHPKWLYYFLGQVQVAKWIESKAVGTTMLNLNTSILRSLVIEYPTFDVQARIASILSAYDDLIAANQRRIQLLEESARLLYREWFVKLRFPGHETVPVVDGVPEGWEKKPLGEFVTLNYGKGLKEADRVVGGVPVYGSSGIVGHHNKPLITGPAIIVGRKGNVGSVYYSNCPCFPIDTVYFVSSDQTSYFLYLALQGLNFISSDSAVPGLNRNYTYSLELTVPNAEIFTLFETRVQPIFEQINALTIWNGKLRQARDLLLPKLMSGALDVSRISIPQEVGA